MYERASYFDCERVLPLKCGKFGEIKGIVREVFLRGMENQRPLWGQIWEELFDLRLSLKTGTICLIFCEIYSTAKKIKD